MDKEMNDNIKNVINKYKENKNNNKIKNEAHSYNIPEDKVVSNQQYEQNLYKESDPDLIVGYEILQLPSKGINKYNGIGIDELKVEYLTSKDEDILTTPTLIENGTVLDVLLKRKIKENINIDHLFYGDKNAIVLFLRTSSYGYEYDVEVYDPRTGVPFKTTVDLSKLKYKTITEKPDENGLYTVELDVRKKIIQFKLLTSGEERQIMRTADAKKEAYNTEISEYNSLKLKSHIVNINGNTNRDYINKFVDAMPLKDAYKLRKKILEVTPDVDMEYEFQTKDGYKFKSRLNMGVDFFFPNI